MDIGKMLEDSLEYTKGALWEKWVRWILLIICSILFPFMWGYLLEILRGKRPAPEVENWGALFIDGLKVLFIAIIYAIPVVAVFFLFGGLALIGAIAGASVPDYYAMHPEQVMRLIGQLIGALFLAGILALFLALVEVIGLVRFARMGRIGEAFNFGAIIKQIGKIGWLSYIFALIIVGLVLVVISALVNAIPWVGFILGFILTPPYSIFIARYVTQIYDTAPT